MQAQGSATQSLPCCPSTSSRTGYQAIGKNLGGRRRQEEQQAVWRLRECFQYRGDPIAYDVFG